MPETQITNNGFNPDPSKIRPADGRHDEIGGRINIFKEFALSHTVNVPEEYITDEHYWYTGLTVFHEQNKLLREAIPDKEMRRLAALSTSISSTNRIIEAEKQKAVDPLTKAWSRIALDNFVENLRVRPRRGNEVGVLLIDLDNFKSINDQLGHLAGDNTLRELVQLMQDQLRVSDMVARYGGEEFAVVLPNMTALEEIEDVAERLRITIQNHDFGLNRPVTASIGVTRLLSSDISANNPYNRADKFLYEAKNNGRNVTIGENGVVIPIKKTGHV